MTHTPDHEQNADRAETFDVTLVDVPGGPDVSFPCLPGQDIPTAARASGCRPRVVCERGGCGACRAEVIEGRVEHRGAVSRKKLDGPTPDHPGYVLMCRAFPLEDVVLRPVAKWMPKPLSPMSDVLNSLTTQHKGKKGAH